ncbi:MAG: AtpZ/AtpI family protein [Eubacterium sp.]|jgi:flagellar biogenesis protein FliO|nr:AtpZ/AtpI family protein [Eubacterium sp.]
MAADKDNLSITDDDRNPNTTGEILKQGLKTYVIAGQLSFAILTPLLIFVVGGAWAVRRFDLPVFFAVIFIMFGILTMIGSLVSYLRRLISIYGKDKKDKHRKYKTDRKDYDY